MNAVLSQRPNVRLATFDDLEALDAHHARHGRESGREGDFIFTPVDDSAQTDPGTSADAVAAAYARFVERTRERWARAVTDVDWERTWVIADAKPAFASDGLGSKIYGDLMLVHRPPLSSSLHRATLMMGIERPYRGQGYGSELLRHAITWAKAQPSIDWLQLFVFAGNLPAQALYKRFGFIENGRVEDMFRVRGVSITNISMSLQLR